MGQQGDDIVSLPLPPPPNPAARRSAIETALRKFDGIDETAPARRSPWQWASSHRRATGGLVTAALIAVVGIPAMQIALQDQPQEGASEAVAPGLTTADVEPVPDNVAAEVSEASSEQPATVPVARSEPLETASEAAAPEEERVGFTEADSVRKARPATAAPMISAPAPSVAVAAAPPPPPPPPPSAPPPPAPMAQRDAATSQRMAESEAADAVAAESGSIVVTGSKARRGNLESASPVTVIDPYPEFQERLRSAFRSNDRQAILRLVGLPLRVSFDGDVRTYGTRKDVERDFDRIFTADVRSSVLSGQESRHLTVTRSGGSMKIRGVRP